MTFGIVKIPHLDFDIQGNLAKSIESLGYDGTDITEVRTVSLRGDRTVTLYKKDSKAKKVLNNLLGTKFRSVLRCEKNMGGGFD